MVIALIFDSRLGYECYGYNQSFLWPRQVHTAFQGVKHSEVGCLILNIRRTREHTRRWRIFVLQASIVGGLGPYSRSCTVQKRTSVSENKKNRLMKTMNP